MVLNGRLASQLADARRVRLLLDIIIHNGTQLPRVFHGDDGLQWAVVTHSELNFCLARGNTKNA